VANEGKVLVFVAPDRAEQALEAMRRHPLGEDATIIGNAVAQHAGLVVARTTIGATRIITPQIGEQLPRIC